MPIKTSIRRIIYRSEKLVQHARFATLPTPANGWPILLGLSFPKSGTHLLDQILLGFAQVAPFSRRLHSFYAEYEGESGHKKSPEQAIVWLDSLQHGDVASAHLFARPEAVNRVKHPTFVPYFIFRDPRDVVVSHVFYVTEMEPNHIHHSYYNSLPDFSSRLKVSILGRPDVDVEFPDITGRFAPYLNWLDQPSVLTLHFEALIHARAQTLGRIADHLISRVGKSIRASRETIIAAMETAINPGKSPTFRSGKTGEWKKHFTNEHKRIFKDIAGDLLVKLGYEKDLNW